MKNEKRVISAVAEFLKDHLSTEEIEMLTDELLKDESHKLFRLDSYWLWVSPGLNLPYWISDLDGDEMGAYATRGEALNNMIDLLTVGKTSEDYEDIVHYISPTDGQTVLSKVIRRFDNGDVRTELDGMRTYNEVSSIYMLSGRCDVKAGPNTKLVGLHKFDDVFPASNIPGTGFWAAYSDKWSEEVKSISRSYGLFVPEEHVEIVTFHEQ